MARIAADLGGVLIGLRGPALGAEPGDLGGLQRGMCTAGRDCLRRPGGAPGGFYWPARGELGVFATIAAFTAGQPWLDALLATLEMRR
jgi:hypothetical protein